MKTSKVVMKVWQAQLKEIALAYTGANKVIVNQGLEETCVHDNNPKACRHCEFGRVLNEAYDKHLKA